MSKEKVLCSFIVKNEIKKEQSNYSPCIKAWQLYIFIILEKRV